MRQWVVPIVLAAVMLLLVPVVGFGAVFGSLAVIILWFFARGQRGSATVAVVGGAIGALSAAQALLRNDPSDPRWWLGVAAFVLALVAGANRGTVVTLSAGVLGCIAINLFDIDTFYLVAVPFWLVAGFTGSSQPDSKVSP